MPSIFLAKTRHTITSNFNFVRCCLAFTQVVYNKKLQTWFRFKYERIFSNKDRVFGVFHLNGDNFSTRMKLIWLNEVNTASGTVHHGNDLCRLYVGSSCSVIKNWLDISLTTKISMESRGQFEIDRSRQIDEIFFVRRKKNNRKNSNWIKSQGLCANDNRCTRPKKTKNKIKQS